MSKVIDETEHYRITSDIYLCCDTQMFRYYCKKCDEFMSCYYCEFDYSEPHQDCSGENE